MHVAVGSQNRVKIEAVRLAFKNFWPEQEITTAAFPVGSTVSDQPMSADETQRGARSRAIAALRASSGASYGVGLEGGIEQYGSSWVNSGWVVVVDEARRVGIASTVRVEVLEPVMDLVRSGNELGTACDIYFDTANSKTAGGHFSLMTHGLLNRTDAFRDAVTAAIGSLQFRQKY